jgi:hemolysin D
MSTKHRLQAYRGLLQHYRSVFNHAWSHRHDLKTGLLQEHEAEFLPAALSLQERPVSPGSRLTAKILMGLVACTLLWSVLGKIDIIVNASGKIIASGRTKTIASVDTASVHAIHVMEGQAVKAGDVLVELDTSETYAERDKASGEAITATLQADRSQALIDAVNTLTPPKLPKRDNIPESQWQAEQAHLDGQYHDFRAKLAQIDSDIQRYAIALPLATQQAHDYRDLAKDHDVSLHAYLDKEQARIDLEGKLADAKDQRAALITQTKKDAYDALTDGYKTASAAQQDKIKAESHGRLLMLTAPVDGTVQQVNVNTVGGVVAAAQPLMMVVPKQNHIEIEALLENKDIGFLEEGQSAEVKVDAYEYTKYGTITGKVTHVSHDSIKDEQDPQNLQKLRYSVIVTLDKSALDVDGKEMPLTPGMTVNVEVKTGERRVIEYVLSPLLQHEHESLHER